MTIRTAIPMALILVFACGAQAALDVAANGNGDYPTIQAALNVAADGDTILLGYGIYSGPGNRDLEFYSDVVVLSELGYEYTVIDCEGSPAEPHRAFSLFEETAGTVRGIAIVNGWTADGGAIGTGWGNYFFEDCLFLDNHATGDGGVLWTSDGALVHVRNCVVSNNSAGDQGGALYATGDARIVVQNCTLVRNGASEGGGIYLDEGTTTMVENSILAYSLGGGAFDGSYFDDALFLASNLYANRGGDWANGATGLGSSHNIMADPLLRDPMELPIPDVRLAFGSPCRADQTGTGIRMGAGEESISRDVLYGIKADGSGLFQTAMQATYLVPDGGVIVLEDEYYPAPGFTNLSLGGASLRSRLEDPSTCTVDMTGYTGYFAFGMGSNPTRAFVRGITYTGCNRGTSGIVTLIGDGHVVMEDCVFTGNYLNGDAALLRGYVDSTLEVRRCEFVDNISDSNDPLIFTSGVAGTAMTFTDCTIQGNTVHRELIESDGPSMTLDGCTIAENSGFAAISGTLDALVMTGTRVEGNTVGLADLMDFDDATVTLTGCEFLDNISADRMISLNGCDVSVEQCLFRGNVADARGGALHLLYSAGTVERTRFEDNEGDLEGGAVYIDVANEDRGYDDSLVFDLCEFTGNIAPRGGGLSAAVDGGYLVDPSSQTQALLLRIQGCTFHANRTSFSSSGQIGFDTTLIGDWVSTGTLDLRIDECLVTDGNAQGIYGTFNADSSGDVVCTNIHGNEDGDWNGDWLEDEFLMFSNTSHDPLYCDADTGDLTLRSDSPCLAANTPCNVDIGANGQGCDVQTGVGDVPGAMASTGITSNHPNPFNPMTTIRFELAASGAVDLAVYDLAGRLVRTLAEGAMHEAGAGELVWDGRDTRGAVMEAGVYLVRLRTGGAVSQRKVMMLK